MGNKYERTPEFVLDLHGHSTAKAKAALDSLLQNSRYSHVRIITGKGSFRPTGPVLRTFVKKYLTARGIRFSQSKIQDGGEGALELYL